MIDSSSALVIGGRGFVGRHLVAALARAGYGVTSIDTAAVTDRATGARELVLDTRDTAAVVALAKDSGITTVFDLASHTNVGLGKSAYQRNVELTVSMLDVVDNCEIPRYVFFSTQFVFRRPGQLPRGEDDFFPVDYYGASKVESELTIRSRLSRDRYLILRPTYVWGPGLLRFRDGLLYRLAKGQLLISSDPSVVRYYGYVKTVAAQAIALSQRAFSERENVYYLSDDAIRLTTFCEALRAALGRGNAIEIPGAVIRVLGVIGSGLAAVGLPTPINAMQARELTTNFPVPIAHTLEFTGQQTDLAVAAAETVAWARSDSEWLGRIGI